MKRILFAFVLSLVGLGLGSSSVRAVTLTWSGSTVIYPIVNNTGTVDAETGTLSFHGGGTIDGQFHAAAGATVAFDAGSYTGGNAPQFTGAGAFKFNSGTLTLLNNLGSTFQK